MKGLVWGSIGFAILVCLSAIAPVYASGSEDDITRATGEIITIDIDVSFDGPLNTNLEVKLFVEQMYLNNVLRTADELRTLYEASPNGTIDQFDDEIQSRILNLTTTSFQGDSFEMVSGSLDLMTLDNSTSGPGDPIIYNIEIIGSTQIERYIDRERADLLDDGREDMFITSLFLSGFRFQRTVGLIAQAGETVNYRFPTTFDPIGDGDITLALSSNDADISDYKYQITVDGTQGYAETYFGFTISHEGANVPMDEQVSGEITIDWKDLDTVGVQGKADITSIRSDRSDLLNSIPDSMTVPDFVPASLIRYCHLEGILNDQDLNTISMEFEGEVETTIREAIGDDTLLTAVEIDTGSDGIQKPLIGTDLKGIIFSTDSIVATITTEKDSVLDILKGYEKDDVRGLLNGGLKLYHDFDPVYDDRFDVFLMTPENIEIWGDPHVRENGTRKIYTYTPGRRLIGSSLDPEYDGSSMAIIGSFDISEVDSLYGLDAEVNIKANIEFELSVMEFDQDDVELTTEMEYEIDYLSSDMIRLLMDMDIIDREEIEEKIEDDFNDGIGDILPDGDTLIIDILDESLIFDGDIENVTGDLPITLSIIVDSTLGFNDLLDEDNGNDDPAMNGIIPVHIDPLLPARKLTRTIDLGEGKNWFIDLEISLPSGIGIQAWTGLEENDHVKDMEVTTEGGYPTLHIKLEPGEADRITIEGQVGGYLLFNNIGACFGCCLLGILVVLIMILLLIIKAIRKKKGKKSSEKKGKGKKRRKASEEEKSEEEQENEMSWDDS